MSLYKGIKEKLGFNAEEDLDEQMDYPEDVMDETEVGNYPPSDNGGFRPAPRANFASAPASAVSASSNVMIFEPKTFAESDSIINKLRSGHHVIVNFEQTDHVEAKRIMDFMSGGVYAINGSIEQVGANILLCLPATAKFTRNPDDTTKAYSNLTDTLSWKEPEV